MKHKVTIWGFSLAGLLWILAGLRDIFAPGFFNVSPQVANKTSIIVSFALGVMFLALALSVSKGIFDRAQSKR